MPAWTAPRTWVTSEVVTSALMNTHVRDNLLNAHYEYGTTLPASPSDGQLAILVDSTSAPTYRWTFRYNSSKATNKWEFIGGTDLVGPASTITHANVTTYRFQTATNLVVPKSGDYDVILASFFGTAAAVSRAMYTVGIDGAADDTYATATYGTQYAGLNHITRRSLTAASTLSVAYRAVDGSVGFTIYSPHVRLRPVAVT